MPKIDRQNEPTNDRKSDKFGMRIAAQTVKSRYENICN